MGFVLPIGYFYLVSALLHWSGKAAPLVEFPTRPDGEVTVLTYLAFVFNALAAPLQIAFLQYDLWMPAKVVVTLVGLLLFYRALRFAREG